MIATTTIHPATQWTTILPAIPWNVGSILGDAGGSSGAGIGGATGGVVGRGGIGGETAAAVGAWGWPSLSWLTRGDSPGDGGEETGAWS